MWDVAAVEAVVHPELATEKPAAVPDGYGSRKVWVYTKIDARRMEEDFWAALRAHRQRNDGSE
jgi:hypothetical protein